VLRPTLAIRLSRIQERQKKVRNPLQVRSKNIFEDNKYTCSGTREFAENSSYDLSYEQSTTVKQDEGNVGRNKSR
jgi:hypothetical protein